MRISILKMCPKVDPKDFKPVEAKKLAVDSRYNSRFDSGLVFILSIVTCTIYFLWKIH